MDIDELCTAVNRRLRAEKIKVEDGRTAGRVTPRNVRYYRTIGLLSPPERAGGRANYTNSHLDEIVRIKRSQAEGRSLEEIRAARRIAHDILEDGRSRGVDRRWLSSAGFASAAGESPLLQLAMNRAMSVDDDLPPRSGLGWSIRVGGVTLSGMGLPPTQEQVDSITRILSIERTD